MGPKYSKYQKERKLNFREFSQRFSVDIRSQEDKKRVNESDFVIRAFFAAKNGMMQEFITTED